LDLSRVAVGGISAGGHLSAIVAHMARDNGISLAFQMLGVPVVDLSIFTPTGELRPDQPYESYRELFHTQPLSAERMSWFHNQFLGSPRPKEYDGDYRVSPILANNFVGLAPALIVTAEMDVLKGEGEAYGKKMNDAGSKAQIHEIKGACHLIAQMDEICEGGKEYNRVVLKALKEALKA
jgi:acetyl esterase/lipase